MDTLKEILAQNDFEFKKQLGQNFLTDTNLLKAIVADAGITKDDEVLEIGSGAGSLTQVLSMAAKKVVSFEIDKKLEPILQKTLHGLENVEVVFEDILSQSDEGLSAHFNSPIKIVANLPYYITTPIIFRFLESNLNITSLTIMVQKEVAERLVAKSGTKDYGTISVSANYRADVKIMRIVNRQLFTPVPNVDSAIVHISINRKKYEIKDEAVLNKLIKAAFHMRRKTLSNNLKQSFNLDLQKIQQLLASCNLDEKVRGEALSVQQFVSLANEMSK